MKLFIDAHLFDGAGQGTKTYLNGLYSSLIPRRPDIDFYMGASNTENLQSTFLKASNLHYLAYGSGNKFFRLAKKIPQLIKENKIDTAHFQYVSPLIKSCGEIVTIHDILFLDFPQYFPFSYRLVKNFLFKRSAQRADWILTVSQYSKEALIRHYKVAPDKIVITPNGVLDLFFKTDLNEILRDDFPKRPFILYVSRFEPRKNQHGLLKAYMDLQVWKNDVDLVFIGTPGVYSPEFTGLYDSLSMERKKNVLFYSDVTTPEMKQFYEKCLLSVYPSFAEGFGIPPLEAAVCGANVICSGLTAMQEFDFFGDRLFNPHHEEEFKDKISYFVNHPPSIEEKNRIRTSIREKYSWDHSADIFSTSVLKKF